MEVLKVPLVKSPSSSSSGSGEKVDGISVWEWSGSAVDEGAAAAQWFSNYLGKPSRLVRFNHEFAAAVSCISTKTWKKSSRQVIEVHYYPKMTIPRPQEVVSGVRKVEADYAPGYNVMFADMYPFLLLSQGSMDALNARLKEPVAVNRFRPNILVDGCEPFCEDLWTEMRIKNATFKGVKLCSRCKVPTVNQETGTAGGSEPTDTLLSFRSDKALRPNNKHQKGKVYFGQNLVCTDSLATKPGNGKTVKLGDTLIVLKTVPSADAAAA